MKFPTALNVAELPTTIRRFIGLVGWRKWKRRLHSLTDQIKRNTLWSSLFMERHAIELSLGTVTNYISRTSRCPWPPRNSAEYQLYSFAAMAVRVSEQLTPIGHKRFVGALCAGLDGEFGLAPLAMELRVASHLMSREFDVHFHDVEHGGGYDLLASKDNIRIEIECKFISADIGRQIHRRDLYSLGTKLLPIFNRHSETIENGQIIEITLNGRLKKSNEHQGMLVSAVDHALAKHDTKHEDYIGSISVTPFDIDNSPFSHKTGHNLSMQDIREYLQNTFGIQNTNSIPFWSPGKSAIILALKSDRKDEVLKTVKKKIKEDAKNQFSLTLPGMMCLHLADVTEEEILEVAQADKIGNTTGIQFAMNEILYTRNHLHSIALMTHGSVLLGKQRNLGVMKTSIWEQGPAYIFSSSQHPLRDNPVLESLFI